jgi:hypothetical protein
MSLFFTCFLLKCLSQKIKAIIFAHEREWLGGNAHHLLQHHDDTAGHSHGQASSVIGVEEGGETEHLHGEEEAHFEHETHSTMRAVILVLAISLHVSFFNMNI